MSRNLLAVLFCASCCAAAQALEPLTEVPGDAARGQRLYADPERGHCQLCHRLTQLPLPFAGTIGPDLSAVGSRRSAAELRAQIVDPTRRNPEAGMPAYYRWVDLHNVAKQYQGLPILTAQEVEDLVAFLQTLRADIGR